MIDGVEPWMSDESIRSGQSWFAEIMRAVSTVRIGIICLTPDNLRSEWIHFESGAIANKVSENSRVIPYLIGVPGHEVRPPLGQFQHREATREPTRRLIKDINDATEHTVADGILDQRFEQFWPDLETSIKTAPVPEGATPKTRSTDELAGEILDLVRGLRADVRPPPPPAPRPGLRIAELRELQRNGLVTFNGVDISRITQTSDLEESLARWSTLLAARLERERGLLR
jgi:hypothetical protein